MILLGLYHAPRIIKRSALQSNGESFLLRQRQVTRKYVKRKFVVSEVSHSLGQRSYVEECESIAFVKPQNGGFAVL
jgi:hypothetical protein